MVGAMCGALGVYIVLQGMSYIGHGLAHAVFGGAVVAFMARWNFYLGAGIWGVLSALWINSLSRRPEIKADAAIGIITTASFALGVALISRARSYTPSVEAMLFGNILGVDRTDLLVVAAVLVASTSCCWFTTAHCCSTPSIARSPRCRGFRPVWFRSSLRSCWPR